MVLAFLITVIFAVAQFSAAISDVKSMKIPNWSCLFMLATFFLVTPFVWQDLNVFLEHLAVGSSVFLITFAMFSARLWGGGDAKLMAATAFWWQWPDMLMYLVYTVVAGGVIAMFIIFAIIARKFAPVRISTSPVFDLVIKEDLKMPYGLALGIGAMATLPQSQIFMTAAGMI